MLFIQDTKGFSFGHPAQMMLLMGIMGLHRGWVTVSNIKVDTFCMFRIIKRCFTHWRRVSHLLNTNLKLEHPTSFCLFSIQDEERGRNAKLETICPRFPEPQPLQHPIPSLKEALEKVRDVTQMCKRHFPPSSKGWGHVDHTNPSHKCCCSRQMLIWDQHHYTRVTTHGPSLMKTSGRQMSCELQHICAIRFSQKTLYKIKELRFDL